MKKIPNFDLQPVNGATGSIIVKFIDQVKARCEEGEVTSYSGADLSILDQLIQDNSLEVEPLFKLSFERLAAIEDKAVNFSNKGQPDLASMMKISGPRGSLQQVARQLNDMAIVEYVEFETIPVTAMSDEVMACCLQNAVGGRVLCIPLSLPDCIAMNGSPNENFTGAFACADLEEILGPDACVGACCFFDEDNLSDCQSGVSPLDCAGNPFFINSTFNGRGTICLEDGGTIDCDPRGPCCIENDLGGDPLCLPISKEDCLARGENARFTTAGVGITCPIDDNDEDVCANPGCGDEWAGNCFVPTPLPIGGIDPSGNSPFCDLDNCCQTVCQLLPECCNNDVNDPGDWDELCAAFANAFREDSRDDLSICFGEPPPPVGPCNISGTSCFLAATSPGCSINSCCVSVCSVDPACCEESFGWDQDCADLAKLICSNESEDFLGTPPDFHAPDFYGMGVQGYLTVEPYEGDPRSNFAIPEAIVGGLFIPSCIGGQRSTPDISAFRSRPPFGTIEGFAGEGFDLKGLEDAGRALATLGKGDIGMSQGKNIRIGVLDHSAYIQDISVNSLNGIHEDLVGQVTIIPTDRPMTLLPPPITDPDHGTAVLGIVGARTEFDGQGNVINDFGIVSMAPRSEVFFFPASSLEDGGRFLAAMVDVVETFDPGDVLYIPLGLGSFGAAGCGNLLSNALNWLMADMITSAGISVVVAADNNSCDLIASPQAGNAETLDATVIVVGACTPGAPYKRLSASNHCTQCTDVSGDIVHVSAWGAAVATLGYGDMWDGGNVSDPLNNYTNSFRYTSAAGAQIAALVARYQGLAKQMYGMPLSPAQIRTRPDATFEARGLLHPDFLWDQDARVIPLGSPTGLECFGDFSFADDPNNIGGFPDARLGAAWAIVGGHFGESARMLRNVAILKGTHIFGTHFALGAVDGTYLTVESEFTNKGDAPNPVTPPDPTLRSATYLAAGEIVDIVVDLEAQLTVIEQLEVDTVIATTTNALVSSNLLIVELYDWTNRRWDFVGFDFTDNLDTPRTFPVVFGVQRFVRALDDKIKVRLYTLSMGPRVLSRSENTHYTTKFDFVGIDVGIVPGNGAIQHPLP